MSKDNDEESPPKKRSRLGRRVRFQNGGFEDSLIKTERFVMEDRELTAEEFQLGEALIEAAKGWDINRIKELRELGAPVNFQAPHNQMTILHYAADCGHQEMAEEILKGGWRDPVNLLLRDFKGMLPSGRAAQGSGAGNVMGLAKKLMEMEKEQGLQRNPPIEPRMYEDVPISENHITIDDGPDI